MPSSLIATLPMYDWPETASAWDTLWHAVHSELADAGIEATPALKRADDPWVVWRDPSLILGQTCGWPYVSALRGEVVPFGRLDFGLPTERPGDYYSIFIGPKGTALACEAPGDLAPLIDDPAAIIAVNGTDSQSGFRVLGECFDRPLDLPRERLLVTGSHRGSIRAVAQGRAAFAAIDAVTWQIALEHEPAAPEVSVIGHSSPVPGLPLIVAKELAGQSQTVFAAVERGLDRLRGETRTALGIRGVVPAEGADYDVLQRPPFGNLRVAEV